MKCLDRNSLEEQTRLVPRYVAGDLSRSERAEFEAWLVASPELAAEVDMERRLRRGMASANRRGWLNRGAPAHVHQNRRWHMAIAASTLVAIGLAFSLTLPRDDSGGTESPRITASSSPRPASPLTVRLGKVRGSGDVPDIIVEPDVVVLTCENGAVELECAGGGIPQTPQYAEYEVDLVKRRGAVLAWRSARQEPAMRTELSFTLRDPGSLSAGDYDLIVRGVSPDHQEVVGRFWVQVTAN
jgi:ferric-dicitrate binding protein FerR (iron transport regulator)